MSTGAVGLQEARRNKTRRSFLGGSDARIIMGSDEAALLRLWQEKRGVIEPEDLSGNLIVQLGSVTEDLNRRWFERETGQAITEVQRRELLQEEVNKAGSQLAWAKRVGARSTDVNNMLHGRRLPVQSILDGLGFERVLAYRSRQASRFVALRTEDVLDMIMRARGAR